MSTLNIKKTESGKYTIQIRLGDQRVRVTENTEAEVRRKVERLKAQHVLRKNHKIVMSGSLGGILDDYIESRKNVLSPSTINGYMNVRKNRFKNYMTSMASKVNYQKMINDEANSYSAKTIKNAWGAVSAALEYAGYDVPKVRLPASVKHEHPYLEPDQIQQFISVIKNQPCEMACLLGLCSLRKSEIFGLKHSDIDFDKNVIHVHAAYVIDPDNHYTQKESTKTLGSDRYVPIMIPRLKELLHDADPNAEKLVPGYPSNLYKQIGRACGEMGIENIGVHGLRHSFASLAYHLQLPERVAMSIGGWTDINTMHRIYTHIAQKDISNYADKYADFFKSL